MTMCTSLRDTCKLQPSLKENVLEVGADKRHPHGQRHGFSVPLGVSETCIIMLMMLTYSCRLSFSDNRGSHFFSSSLSFVLKPRSCDARKEGQITKIVSSEKFLHPRPRRGFSFCKSLFSSAWPRLGAVSWRNSLQTKWTRGEMSGFSVRDRTPAASTKGTNLWRWCLRSFIYLFYNGQGHLKLLKLEKWQTAVNI